MKPGSSDQLLLSIGALLASERERRGIPVEKAAKETRMRPQRIRDMENDDLSHFTNPSYARMFIIAYAKYLDVPMQRIRDHLPDRGESGSEGYQYITAEPGELPSLRRDLVSQPVQRNRWVTTALIAAVVLLLGAIGLIGAYIYVNIPRITAVVNKPPPTPEPTPVAPPPPPATIESIGLKNLPANAEDAVADLAVSPELHRPPTPTPAVVQMDQPAPPPSTAVPPAPATSPSADDDRAFLLGASPDQTPATVQ